MKDQAVVADGSVFVVPRDGVLYAVSPREGTEQWRFKPEYGIDNPPAVADGTVYVASFGGLYALDAGDGSERWSTEIRADRVTIANGTVYGVSRGGSISALDAETGDQLWTQSLDEGVRAAPAVDGESVYVTTNEGTVYALAVGDGSERWVFETDSEYLYAAPTVGDGTVYVAVGRVDDGGYYYAVDTEDGSEQWQLRSRNTDLDTTVSVADDTVYLEGFGGISARSTADGSERWSASTGGGEATGIAITESTAVVASVGGVVSAFSRDDGSVRWRRSVGEIIFVSPVVADGVVYVATEGGGLRAFADELPPTPSPTPSPTPTLSPTPTPTATPTSTPTATEAPTPTETTAATPDEVPYALREGVKTVVDTGYGTYYLIRRIPEADPRQVAVTTTDYGLVDRTTTKDVVALDTFSDGLWAVDWDREVERMRTVRDASETYETLGRVTQLGWDIAEIVVFLSGRYTSALVGPALGIMSDAISWSMDPVSRPYREAFQKLTACLQNAESIDQRARDLRSYSGLDEELRTWTDAAALLHSGVSSGLTLASAWGQYLSALGTAGASAFSTSASTALNGARGFFVGLAVTAVSGMIESDVRKKTSVHALQNAYANARLPVVKTLRNLQARFDRDEHTIGDVFVYDAYLQSAYQMNALAFEAASLYWEAIADGWLGAVWNPWSGARRKADAAKTTTRKTQQLFGLAQTEIGDDVTGSINAEFWANGGGA